eukprot:TRINITY_DN2134_c0_g1_i2.p1 TRINITY_DN2134_c0_g1~~TRINITY_DN2134_c0_g1_i2.p1  ORF type:complete len:242 (-),score=27.98 TRINITY_DN2134_c0_g1_i2:400-1125(-)
MAFIQIIQVMATPSKYSFLSIGRIPSYQQESQQYCYTFSFRGGGGVKLESQSTQRHSNKFARSNITHNPIYTISRQEEATPEPELYKLVRIKPDGRCMFRAMVRSLAANKGRNLTPDQETGEADVLRLACAQAICRNEERKKQFPDAIKQLENEGEQLNSYCKRMIRPDFWGGEVEMFVLSKMLKIPIKVYMSEKEVGGSGIGFVNIRTIGEQFGKSKDGQKARKPVRLLFTGGNHFDLLM